VKEVNDVVSNQLHMLDPVEEEVAHVNVVVVVNYGKNFCHHLVRFLFLEYGSLGLVRTGRSIDCFSKRLTPSCFSEEGLNRSSSNKCF
jgi:hypothetical protein